MCCCAHTCCAPREVSYNNIESDNWQAQLQALLAIQDQDQDQDVRSVLRDNGNSNVNVNVENTSVAVALVLFLGLLFDQVQPAAIGETLSQLLNR